LKRIIVGASGATGTIYGIRLLQILRRVPNVETHVVFTPAAWRTLTLETDYRAKDVEAIADKVTSPTTLPRRSLLARSVPRE
jgi:flavin prenyltransferase